MAVSNVIRTPHLRTRELMGFPWPRTLDTETRTPDLLAGAHWVLPHDLPHMSVPVEVGAQTNPSKEG